MLDNKKQDEIKDTKMKFDKPNFEKLYSYLDNKDKDQSGNYDYLNIEQTKKNLQMFEKDIIFFKGYIPNVFQNGDHPNEISWLHIDLNSSQTTLETMEFFYSKIDLQL